MFAKIVLFSQSFDTLGMTYKIPSFLSDSIKIGQIVEVPIGKKISYGVVLSLEEKSSYNIEKIKDILSIKTNINMIHPYQAELLLYISSRYFSLIHNSLSLFISSHLKNKILKDTFSKIKTKELSYTYKNDIKLTQKQNQIYNKILKSDIKKFLLYGVTGSGKTQIYIELIKYYLDKNMQVLLLVPEIILTNQISSRIKKVFGDDVIVINSSIIDTKKTTYYKYIYESRAKIIIGTRSSVFYPFKDLGLIIVDEEHDNSYLSDKTPRYDTIEIVSKISDLIGCKLLLGSGTPKVNHVYDALNGKYEFLQLFSEYEE